MQQTSETLVTLTISQIISIFAFLIVQTIAVVGFIYKLTKRISDNRIILHNKIDLTKKVIDSDIQKFRSENDRQYSGLEAAFVNRVKICDMKHDATKQTLEKNEMQQSEAYNKFTNALDKMTEVMGQTRLVLVEHIAFHKGQEDAKK